MLPRSNLRGGLQERDFFFRSISSFARPSISHRQNAQKDAPDSTRASILIALSLSLSLARQKTRRGGGEGNTLTQNYPKNKKRSMGTPSAEPLSIPTHRNRGNKSRCPRGKETGCRLPQLRDAECRRALFSCRLRFVVSRKPQS